MNQLRSYEKGIKLPATDELVKPGLISAILKIIEWNLPYNCKGCNKDIYKEQSNMNHRCVSCNIGSHKKCIPNPENCPNFICHKYVEPFVKS